MLKKLISFFRKDHPKKVVITLSVEYEAWERAFAKARKNNMDGFYINVKGEIGDVTLVFTSLQGQLERCWKIEQD